MGLLSDFLNSVDQTKRNIKYQGGLLADNPQEFGNRLVEAMKQGYGGLLPDPMLPTSQYMASPAVQQMAANPLGLMGTMKVGSGLMKTIAPDEANKLLNDAWWGGKNSGSKKTNMDLVGNSDGSGYVVAKVPMNKIRPNEAGDLYDGTVNPERAAAYAKQAIDTPVYLLFGERMARNGATAANVMDGGHRVSAARMRGDQEINAIMQRSHFERLFGPMSD